MDLLSNSDATRTRGAQLGGPAEVEVNCCVDDLKLSGEPGDDAPTG